MKKKIIPILFQKELHYMRLRDYITKSRAVPLFGRILLADKKRARNNCPHGGGCPSSGHIERAIDGARAQEGGQQTD